MGVHWCDTPDMHVFCVFCCASVSVRFGLHGVACASCGRARHRRLTVLHIGEAVHERQPHQTLRGRVPHQRIQEDVEGHLFLSTHRQGYIRITVQSKKQTKKTPTYRCISIMERSGVLVNSRYKRSPAVRSRFLWPAQYSQRTAPQKRSLVI